MTDEALEDALLGVAMRLSVRVRCEPFDRAVFGDLSARGGGLCRVKGQLFIYLDQELARPDRIALLAEALSRLDLETIAMMPAVRERIEAHRARREARPKPRHLRRVR